MIRACGPLTAERAARVGAFDDSSLAGGGFDCVFTQDGERLTGNCAVGTASLTGEVKGQRVTRQVQARRTQETVTYTGTVDEAGTRMKGRFTIGDKGGHFTASKQYWPGQGHGQRVIDPRKKYPATERGAAGELVTLAVGVWIWRHAPTLTPWPRLRTYVFVGVLFALAVATPFLPPPGDGIQFAWQALAGYIALASAAGWLDRASWATTV